MKTYSVTTTIFVEAESIKDLQEAVANYWANTKIPVGTDQDDDIVEV